MKKMILAVAILFSFNAVNAQSANDTIADPYNKQNELKLNGLLLLAGAFEASYERNLNEESSIGISFFTPFDNENLDADVKYYISPYYRVFFGKKYAAGFFVEGFGMLNSIDRESFVDSPQGGRYVDKTVTDFALGLGLGGKWITKSGFVFELNAGVGRNLFETDFDDSNLVGKIGFNLGYRF
jgi:hypothetical protein